MRRKELQTLKKLHIIKSNWEYYCIIYIIQIKDIKDIIFSQMAYKEVKSKICYDPLLEIICK